MRKITLISSQREYMQASQYYKQMFVGIGVSRFRFNQSE